jgi:flagellum-specific peptidoglycan hydrolase FlgJ
VLPETIVAMALAESYKGNGKISGLASIHNNYFGIKCGSNWKGKTVNLRTTEIVNGKAVQITDCFRAYDNWAQSAADFAALIFKTSRYQSALSFDNAIDQIAAIVRSGYSTNPNYVQSALTYIRAAETALEEHYIKQAILAGAIFVAIIIIV